MKWTRTFVNRENCEAVGANAEYTRLQLFYRQFFKMYIWNKNTNSQQTWLFPPTCYLWRPCLSTSICRFRILYQIDIVSNINVALGTARRLISLFLSFFGCQPLVTSCELLHICPPVRSSITLMLESSIAYSAHDKCAWFTTDIMMGEWAYEMRGIDRQCFSMLREALDISLFSLSLQS